MFNDTSVDILSSDFNLIRTINADIQGYKGSAGFDYGISLALTKRIFCDTFNGFSEDIYFRIAGKLYKPLAIKEWSNYFELYLYQSGRDNVENTIDALFDFFVYEMGTQVTVNGTSTAAVVIDPTEKIGEYDDKYLMTKAVFGTGDLVEYQNKKRIVFSQVEHKKNCYAGRVRPLSHHIAFNFTGDVQWFDVLIESKTFDVVSNQYITLPQGKIIVWLQENTQSTRVTLDQRFINTGRAWKVTGVDRSRVGLMCLYCDLDTINTQYDNLQSEIADYYRYAHKYAITISNLQPVSVEVGKSTQLVYTVTDNGTALTTLPEMICTSSNTSIATVNNTGLIYGVVAGQANITCSIVGYSDATLTVAATVSASATPAYSIAITYNGSAKIYSGGSTAKIFTAVIYQNGVATTGKAVTWSVKNKDGSTGTVAAISAITDTTCGLQAPDNDDNAGKFVTLTATFKDDTSISASLDIEIISI